MRLELNPSIGKLRLVGVAITMGLTMLVLVLLLYSLGGTTSAYADDGINVQAVTGDWDGDGVHTSGVISDESMYKMWYNGWCMDTDGIGLATSLNGTTWDKFVGNPVLVATDAWEQGTVNHPHVIKDGGIYKMWYGAGNDAKIGYATSNDGTNWNKYANNPVLEGTPASWDESGVGGPFVITTAVGYYQMWYHSGDLTAIGYATSTNGINWVKHPNSVLTLGPNGDWDDVQVADPNVLLNGGNYHMWYAGYDEVGWPNGHWRIGYAWSNDGITWNKDANNPVLEEGTPGTWDEGGVSEPNVLFDGATYRMWFSGFPFYPVDLVGMQRGYATSATETDWAKYGGNPVLRHGTPCGQPAPQPVGGLIVPVSKLELLAPWMGWVTLGCLAALGVALVKRRVA
jgi:predicted GH43/DUF377 family glycosyl hydrolase